MRRDEALEKLKSLRPFLKERGVKRLRIFGSVARDEATPKSDIDLIVEFSHQPDLIEFIALQQDLGEALGANVDLATPTSLRPELKADILGGSRRCQRVSFAFSDDIIQAATDISAHIDGYDLRRFAK